MSFSVSMQIASRHQGVLATAGAQQTWHGMQARLTRYRSGRKLWSAEAVSRSHCAVRAMLPALRHCSRGTGTGFMRSAAETKSRQTYPERLRLLDPGNA